MIKSYGEVIAHATAVLSAWDGKKVFMAVDLDNVPVVTKTVKSGIMEELRKVDIARELHVQFVPNTDRAVVTIPLTVDTYDVNISFAMPSYSFNEDTEKEPRQIYIETLVEQRDLIQNQVAKYLNV